MGINPPIRGSIVMQDLEEEATKLGLNPPIRGSIEAQKKQTLYSVGEVSIPL